MKNSKNLRKWLDDMDLSHPILIAGPCSAETEDQVLDIAHQLKDSDTIVYRAVFGSQEQDLEILKVLVL